MREKQTYENTITGKLEALPIPDMSDAIWSRIEAQLDIDLPTDDGGGNTPGPGSPFGFGWIGGSALLILVAGIISFFYFSNTNETAGTVPVQLRPPQADSIGLGYTATDPPPKNNPSITTPTDPGNHPPDSINAINNQNLGIGSSKAITAVTNPTAVDTIQQAGTAPIALTPNKDSTPPGRRQRGVKGITDADYRIVPKKDST
jgi:hypothetical protein